jgi:uncharacterized phage-associated protein
MYSAKAVANYFLDLAVKDGKAVTPMQIQKLVYFAHGWHLAVMKAPLIDEPIQAWRYGPVIPSLYHAFKSNGSNPITGRACDFAVDDDLVFRAEEPEVPPTDVATRQLIDNVWQAYKDFSGVQLSNMTHEPDSPWDKMWKSAAGKKSIEIPDAMMAEYFSTLLNGNRPQ